MSYGDDFQRFSKYLRETLQGKRLAWDQKPNPYKEYPADLERITLEEPDRSGGTPLFEVLQKRRSERNYKTRPLSKKELSQVIWAAQGVTRATGYHQFRTAPSAGALYPVETYCVINRVSEMKPGVYHYQVPEHSLALLKEGDYGTELAQAGLGQAMIRDAAFVLVFSALVERAKWKYDQRAYRYIYMDAGHIAQNAALAAVSLDLGSCQIGAFFDQEVNKVIEVDGEEETAIYMTTIGEPR
ncbi:MAG: SagB/ThcOx family dehydrogenase [Bacillota bacterium]